MSGHYIGAYIGKPENWDARFLSLAKFISSWSKDPSTKTGVVIVDPINRSIVSMGFNGLPVGVEDTAERLADRDTKYKMIVHADINALLFARSSVEGCVMYTWPFPPCSRCAGAIIQAGIQQVLAPEPSEDILSRWEQDLVLACKMFDEAGVPIYLADFK